MRRDIRRRKDNEGFSTKKMLYMAGSAIALAVIAFVITFLIYGNKVNSSKEFAKLNLKDDSIGNLVPAEETSSSFGKTVEELKDSKNETEKIAVNTSQMNESKETKNNSNAKVVKDSNNKKNTAKEDAVITNARSTEKIPDPEFKMPVTGEIIKEFANNKLVYSNTLDVWATHNGIDIKADKTTVVKSSADGKVASIKNDPRYGLTVIVEHVNGYKTVYANLLSTEFVTEGENVKQGQSLGTVGNTASFEISDEPHLHFELLKNNEQQDPELYLKK